MCAQRYLFTKEQSLINSIKDWSASPFIGDDCAVVSNKLLLTMDTLVEGTHFLLPLISWRDLGWKALAVNLSDIAAMAGRPRLLMVSITVAPGLDKHAFRELYQSMVECGQSYKSVIAGGDLTKGAKVSITVSVQGDVHENGCLLRSGAKPDDVVVVTGDFGASRAGLWILQNQFEERSNFPHCFSKHVRPVPRLCESWSMVRRTGSQGALMDASDGLADALEQISRASNVGLEVDLEKLPIDEETVSIARLAGANPVDWALYGGEDYELVGCMSRQIWDSWHDDNPFKMIGTVVSSGSVRFKYGEKPGPELNLSQCFEQIDF